MTQTILLASLLILFHTLCASLIFPLLFSSHLCIFFKKLSNDISRCLLSSQKSSFSKRPNRMLHLVPLSQQEKGENLY